MTTLTRDIRRGLEEIVGSDFVRTESDALAVYGRDTCDLFEARPSAVVLPGSTEEVQGVVRLAGKHGLAIVPSGGRTGLSGGATASRGELVLSLERMNRIIAASAADQTLRCQAGVVTARVQQKAEEMGLYYPVDYAAAGSSHIGGNIATNAGGNKVIRYGMTRRWVAALQVVTGDGKVVELGRALHKDNTGYDLLQLVIASEGTLGVITEATMRLTSPPAESAVMVLGLGSYAYLTAVLETFRKVVTLNAFEFFTEAALSRVVARHGLNRPFEDTAPVYALIEFESARESDRQAALGAYEHCHAEAWVGQGTISHSGREARDLWRLRDDISETLSQWSPYKNDLSVPISAVPDFLADIESYVASHYPGIEVISYGHIGDGNVHLNMLKPGGMATEAFKAHCDQASTGIFELLRRYGGSISAEHGVGLLKKPYLEYTRSEEELRLMRAIKTAFDPSGLMNPGKVFG